MSHTDTNNNNLPVVLCYGLLFALVLLLVYLRAMPLVTAMPATDQGLWLYIGKAMLSGQVPYRDIWDQKGPVIYFIDALGLALAGKSAWGVWALEYCCMLLAAVWGFITLTRAFGRKPAVLGTLLWIVSLVLVMEEGNFTETYALALGFIIFTNYLHTCQTAPSRRAATLIGACGALCFFLRPNLIGALLACVVSWTALAVISRRWRAWGTHIVYAGLGFLGITLLICGYFIHHHALGALYDQMLRYNLKGIAIHHTVKSRLNVAEFCMQQLGPLSFIAALMWFAGMKRIRRIVSTNNVFNNALLFAVISWPIEFVLTLLSGNTFYHYLTPLLLPISILITWSVTILLRAIASLPNWLEADSPSSATASSKENYACLVVLLLMATPFLIAQKPYIFYLLKPAKLRTEKSPLSYIVADYVTSHTTSSDGVYIWGFDFAILYATGRHSPIKYATIMPFITPRYDPRPHVASFLHDLTAHSPRLIIDMTNAESTSAMSEPESSASLLKVFGHNDNPQARAVWAYICRNYHQVDITPGVVAYQLNNAKLRVE